MTRVVLGISGASGAALGLAVAEILAEGGVETHLVVTRAAERTLRHEVGLDALARLASLVRYRHAIDDIGATIASGSFRSSGMIVAPCSMRVLGAIASITATDLLVRTADTHLKERRRLVLLTRESPLHLGHLRAMTAVTETGAIVAPPVPAFYLKPPSVEAIIAQIAARAVDLLGIEGLRRPEEWDGEDGAP